MSNSKSKSRSASKSKSKSPNSTRKRSSYSPPIIYSEQPPFNQQYRMPKPGRTKLLGKKRIDEELKKPFSEHLTYGYDMYDILKPAVRDRKSISSNTVIPRTLPNSKMLGGISIIDLNTGQPINAYIRINKKLKEVKKILSVQQEIDCPPEYLYFGMKKRFCGPEYWRASFKWQTAPNARNIDRLIANTKTNMKNNMLRNREKWDKLINIISQEQYFNCSVNKNRLDTPGRSFLLFVFNHKIHNRRWTPEDIAAYILELNERVEPLETEMLLKPLGISRMDKHATRKLNDFNAIQREFNSMPQRLPQQVMKKRMAKTKLIKLNKTRNTLNLINNFTLQKFIKDFDMNPHMFQLFVLPVVSIKIHYASISSLSETLPPEPLFTGRFSIYCKFSEVFNEANEKLHLSKQHGIDIKKLKYHPFLPVENKIPVNAKVEIDTYYKYKVMKEPSLRSTDPYSHTLELGAYIS